MKIMVVDDEYFARKAIVQTILDVHPEADLFEAENGQEAWEFIQASPPNMIFCDIRMPLMDGLDLARLIHTHYPDVINVIISGYDDFAYAQRAIRYKVEHYLLKPADKEQIVALLDQFGKRAARAEEKRVEQLLERCLYEEQDLSAELLAASPVTSYAVAVLRTGSGERDELIAWIRNGELSPSSVNYVMIKDRPHADITVMWLYAHGDKQECCRSALKQSKHFLRELISRFSSEKGVQLSIGLSGFRIETSKITEAYSEAKIALLHRLTMGEGQLYFSEELTKKADLENTARTYLYHRVEEWIAVLQQKAIRNETGEAGELIRSILSEAVQLQFPAYALQDLCAKITATVNAVTEMANERSGFGELYARQLDLHQFSSLKEIGEEFIRAIAAAAGCLAECSGKRDVIEDIKHYIERHYDQKIQLEDMAKNVYFTDPTYLSRLFKKKTGMRFSQYLLTIRMQRAKSLLESDTPLSVSEVAGAVGFNDYSYFIQMYRKVYGETPGATRKQLTELDNGDETTSK